MVGERPARSDSMSELQKQSHFMPGFAALFTEAGGAPLPVARRDRLSSVWHAGRETRATSAPATFSRERKKGRIG